MSLFKTREFWNTKCGHDEEFDQFSIHVANIDNAADNSDKIIVGSHSGILRIYGLKSSKLSTDHLDVDELHYDENDLLVEMQFPAPILQVQSGILLSASEKRQLLLLFPRNFGVYSVTSNEGLTSHGFSYSVTLLYEHELPRSAFCLTVGRFGQVKGRDFVCVQALDCCLMFFEQETASFVRVMSGSILLPTSFAYLPAIDAFLIQSADWTLQCYRYQMLAISAQQDEKNSKNLRKVIPDWSFELGEQILQIETVCLESNACLIVVLGERNLFIFRSNGTMFFQKRFDFKAIYCHSYFAYNDQPAVTDAKSNGRLAAKHAADQQQSLLERDLVTLLITEMSTLHIYKSRQLRWASQLPQSYCQVQRANFRFSANCELIGCLTFLSSDGHLALAFLGTNPSVNIVNNAQSSLMNRRSSQRSGKQSAKSSRQSTFSNEDKEQLFTNTQMDKEEFDREMLELRKIINAYNTDFSALIKLNAGAGADGRTTAEENDLVVELVNCRFDAVHDSFSKPSKPDKLQSNNVIDLEFSLASGKSLSNLIVNLNTANCFNITPNLHNLAKLEPSTTVQFRLFYDSLSKLISFHSNQVYLVVNYFNEKNLPRIHSKLIELPMTFFCRLQNQLALGHSRAGSSTNTSHNSSASQRSSAIADRASERTANQSLLSKTLEQSLDQYLLESSGMARQSSNTIAFQFVSKRSTICLSGLLQEMIGRHNLGAKLHKKPDEDGLKSNKVTVQFVNSKLKLVHAEFISSTEDGDRLEQPANDRLATYRVTIVGDDLHSNCIVFNLLIGKLNALCLERAVERIQFSKSSLPIREYFELINLHLALRQSMANKKKQLEEHCERLRVIEKRILLKLKDRNNSNLNNLESLLNVQHQKIMSLVNEILQLEEQFEDESVRLNCCSQLVCSILRCVGNLNDEERQLLEGSFNILPFVQTNDLQGWHERTEQSLSFLLRNHLKDTVDTKSFANVELVQPDDCANLFRLIEMTIEKAFLGNLFTQGRFGMTKNHLERQTILEENEES